MDSSSPEAAREYLIAKQGLATDLSDRHNSSMALADLLIADRDSFRANLAIVNTTLGNQPVFLQPALQALRAEFNDKVMAHCGSDFLAIAASASPVADRLTQLAAAHGQQQQVIRAVFADPIDRDAANQDSLAALKDAFKNVFV